LTKQGTLTRIWAKRGSRPRAPRDLRYEWAYIFGAVCPARGATAALVLPHANTEAFSLHLAEISKEVASGAHAILILDGVGYHAASGLKTPDNITLLPLPSYSPELVWGPSLSRAQCKLSSYGSRAVIWRSAVIVRVAIRGELAIVRDHRATNLYSVGSYRNWTMMQPCASAAKLRGSGPILNRGS
jgi:hypothetical protein